MARILNSVTLTRLSMPVGWSLDVTVGSVSVDADTGAVTPGGMVYALVRRHDGDSVTASDEGSVWLCGVGSDGNVTRLEAPWAGVTGQYGVRTAMLSAYEAAWFELEVDGAVAATAAVGITRRGEDAVAVEMSPSEVTFVEGYAGLVYVNVNAYKGDGQLPYSKSVGMSYLCSTLGDSTALNGGNITWGFETTRDGGFRYRLVYSGAGSAALTLPVSVDITRDGETVQSRDRTLRVRTIARGRSYQPVRVRPWPQVAEGETLTPGCDDGDEWTDVVFVTQTSGKPVYWKCVARCTKVKGTSPGDTVYSGKLSQASDFVAVATDLLLAEGAVISLLQGNAVQVSDGTSVEAGLQGGSGTDDVRIWAGSATPGEAPYRVLKDGTVVMTKAEVHGTVEATSLTLAIDTSGDGGTPNGAICYNKDDITLPELPEGSVRTIRVLNPKVTRTLTDLVIRKGAANVRISTGSFDWQSLTDGDKTISDGGLNSGKLYELLGVRYNTYTWWMVKEL